MNDKQVLPAILSSATYNRSKFQQEREAKPARPAKFMEMLQVQSRINRKYDHPYLLQLRKKG